MSDEPRRINALIAWYRREVDDSIPGRIHSRDIDGGGAPEWHGRFRAWLTAHPAAEDRDGNLIDPLRFWLWRMGRRGAFLYTLACVDFDWHVAARHWHVFDDDAAHDYTRESLRRLWRMMYGPDGQPNEPRRTKKARCAADGCREKTTRLYCSEHTRAV